jgi:hypothetical protein
MNPKLILAFLNQKKSEQGFATVIAVAIGLITIMVGLTMIVRSQSSQTNSIAQKNISQAGGITETGITRSLSLFNQGNNGVFLTKTYDPKNPKTGKTYLKNLDTEINEWNTPATIETTIKDGGCTNSSNSISVNIPSELLTENTIEQKNETYKYKLLGYSYQFINNSTDPVTNDQIETGKGTMLMQGTKGETKANLEITMTVEKRFKTIPDSFPGLFIEKTINLGNNDIYASSTDPVAIICQDCKMSNTTTYCPPDEEKILEGAMGATNGQILEGPIPSSPPSGAVLYNVKPMLGTPNIPPLPLVPDDAINIGEIKKSGSNLTINGVVGATLPRSGDSPTGTTESGKSVYEYKVSALDIGNLNLTINTSSTAAVHLYVTGDINLGGGGQLIHNGSFGNFAIFGNPKNTSKPPSTGTMTTVNGVTTSQNFVLSGGSSTEMFVYAPDSKISINGGSGTGDIQGVVWAKVWDGSSSNNAELVIPAGAADSLESNLFGSTWERPALTETVFTNSAPTSWQRKAVN